MLAQDYLLRAVQLETEEPTLAIVTSRHTARTFQVAPEGLEVPLVLEVAQVIATRVRGVRA